MDQFTKTLENLCNTHKSLQNLKNPRYTFGIHDYTLRLTGEDKEYVLSQLKNNQHWDGVEKYAVGFEENHCHIVMNPWTTDLKVFRQQVKELFSIQKATHYSLSKIRDNPIKALAYIMKDGDYYVGKAVNKEQEDMAKKLCFGKGRKSFKKLHEELLLSLAKTNNRKKYFKEYVTLKIHHNQKIYWHHIKAHCTQVFMKMDPNYKNDLIQEKWVESGLMSKEEQEEYYNQ